MNSRIGEGARPGYRLVACEGQAHDPRVGGMIDNCGVCAPHWGVCEVLTVEAIQDIAAGRKRATSDMAREMARALERVLAIMWPMGRDPKESGRFAAGLRHEEIVRALRDYGPDVPTVEP